MLEIWFRSLGWEEPLEKAMATHSSSLAWKIPWTEEPGGLQSMGLQRVRHDFTTTLLETPWTAAHQASLSITNSLSLLKLMSFVSLMPSNHLTLCCPFSSCPQSFPASGSLPMSWLFTSGGQSIGVSASASVLPLISFRID